MEILEYLAKNIYNVLNVPAVLKKIDKLEESMHEMKSDVNVIKNDIGTIKDRLDKLEEKTNF